MESNNNDLFEGLGVEVTLPNEDDFLKVRETLTRMGVASKKTNTLFQSCHILHKRGQYAIMHFKELFKLDGRDANIGEDDIVRRNTIVKFLEEWGLVNIKNDSYNVGYEDKTTHVKIISHKEKDQWELKPKYSIGNTRRDGNKS